MLLPFSEDRKVDSERIRRHSFPILGILPYARILDAVDFDESVYVNFEKRLDKLDVLWYNITSVRTAIVRPSPYRTNSSRCGLMSIRR